MLVVGAKGMLGSDVVACLRSRGHEVIEGDLPEFDITNPDSITAVLLGEGKPDWCVNCAAYTAVDAAETHVDEATLVNALGPGYLARACAIAGVRLIHISTDFVFDGLKSTPYEEEDRPNPLAVYGRTKLEGEEAVFAADPRAIVLRTAWLFGPNGKSFPRTMIEAARAGKTLRVVADQIGSPTYTGDLAQVVAAVVEADLPGGLYHAAGPDVMSWHELAVLAVNEDRKLSGDKTPVEIEAISTDDWPTPARRPAYSALANTRFDSLGLTPMRPIEEAMSDFLSFRG